MYMPTNTSFSYTYLHLSTQENHFIGGGETYLSFPSPDKKNNPGGELQGILIFVIKGQMPCI